MAIENVDATAGVFEDHSDDAIIDGPGAQGAIMRVYDASDAIYSGLAALPWRPSYLAAMWILCEELQSLYAAWISDDEVPLMASTMDLVREVVIAGESPQAARRASELAAAWEPVIEAREAETPAGLLNVLATFEALAQEIAGLSGRYDAANWAANAAEQRWQNWGDPGSIYLDPDQQVDDSSPMAQTLVLFARVVSEVAALPGPEWDPVRIRARIFGQP
jgi:hypothetical protein